MLPAKPISAVDAVSPAIEWTKRAMFRPFQWGRWWRIALLGLIAGELQSFSCNFGNQRGVASPRQGGGLPLPGIDHALLFTMIAVLIVGLLVLVLVHMYLASVCRFILFDAVTTSRYRIREGWSRWHERGTRWFGFNLVYMFVAGSIALIILLPFIGVLMHAKRSGAGAMIGAVLLLIPFFLAFAAVFVLLYVLAKDFAIPMIALENERVFTAFGRVLRMVKQRLGDFAGYIGMKIVLSIAYAICFTVAVMMIAIAVAIPVIIIVVAAGITMPNLLQNPVLLAAVITVGFIGVFVLLYLIACLFAPAIFFFQAYVFTWFAQRYEPLWNLLYPAPPQPPPAPEPVIAPPEPPPLPAV